MDKEPSEKFADDLAELIRDEWERVDLVDAVVEVGPVVVVTAEEYSYVVTVQAVRRKAV